MKPLTRATLLTIAWFGLAAPARPAPAEEHNPMEARMEFVAAGDPSADAVRRTGENAINWLGTKLVREATAAGSSADPAATVAACHLSSLPTTGAPIPSMPSITAVKWTSQNLNDKANAPDPADQAALDHVQRAIAGGEPARDALVQRITHSNGAIEWRVYRPLAALPACLQCHGDARSRSPALAAEIDRRFPEGKARDYRAGDWRGLLRVSVNPPPAPKH